MTQLLLTLSLLISYAPQQAGSAALTPELELRVQALGKQLRCAVCQGVAIADSPASMARAQLDRVRELVAEGKSDEEIRAYFVARYGEWVLLDPPARGINWLVWGGPGALLIAGAWAVIHQVRRPVATPSDGRSPGATAAGDPYRSAIRQELDK